MKRIIAILLLACATTLVAQEKKDDDYNVNRELKSKMFTVHNRDPRDLVNAVRYLGSGVKGTVVSYNQETNTIVVRDFPENIASIEDALTRLDKPAPPVPNIDLKVSVLIGSKTPLASASVPDDLAGVVKQLESTLRYTHYGLLTSAVHRTKPGSGSVEGSGVAESAILGITVEGRPVFYNYRLRDLSVRDSSLDIASFNFSMRIPIRSGSNPNDYSYQPVGFETPVSVKQNEKVVIGTTTMGDKALIVVLTAGSNAAQ